MMIPTRARLSAIGRFAVIALILLAGSGCATPMFSPNESMVSPASVGEKFLSFVQDGVASRTQIRARLGEPTSSWQNGAVIGYRLILAEQDRELTESEYRARVRELYPRGARSPLPVWSAINRRRAALIQNGVLPVVRDDGDFAWSRQLLTREAEYGLVLVFDGTDTLLAHSLTPILP